MTTPGVETGLAARDVGVVRSDTTPAADARGSLLQLAALLGWEAPGRGAFGNVIPEGASVVVKPNLVLHDNQGTGGIESLVTDPALILAVT